MTHRVASSLQLHFTRSQPDGPTQLRLTRQDPPQRVIRAFTGTQGEAVVHLHNLSGGILGGDALHLSIEAGENTRAQVTTTSSTRVYRHRSGLPPASQVTQLRVGPGALLEYLPDSLIPFAAARYQQRTCIELAEDSGLFYWDVVAPGRKAAGECFRYDQLVMELDIYAQGQPVLLERVDLTPATRPVSSVALLGEYDYWGTLIICRTGIAPALWLKLESELDSLARQLTRPGEILWGASTLVAHGVVVRVLSKEHAAIAKGLFCFWQQAKRLLYGLEAVPPRKIY